MNYYHVFITKERAHGSNSRLDHSQFTDQALITSAHREEQLGVNITEAWSDRRNHTGCWIVRRLLLRLLDEHVDFPVGRPPRVGGMLDIH